MNEEVKISAWALLLDDNLMSAPRIEAQLKAMGLAVLTARQLPDSPNSPSEEPQLVLLNLGSRPLKGLDKIDVCREKFPAARLVGFCGHLEIEIRLAAKAKGVARILTNDEAMSNLKAALGG